MLQRESLLSWQISCKQFDLILKRLKLLDLELFPANFDVTINKTRFKSL